MTPKPLNSLRLLLPLLASTALAESPSEPEHVDVFVTSAVDVIGAEQLRQQLPHTAINIHTIDGIERIEAMLGDDLPTDADSAEQTALTRLQTFDSRERELLQQSADALLLAWQYRVRRYPAVVFDGRWVVYGITKLDTAYALRQQRPEEGG